MPGGKVAVYTGILPITKDNTGLAVVMGHEVSHALAGHGNERISQAMIAQYGGAILGVLYPIPNGLIFLTKLILWGHK
jgi:Zn-dependent protease with chaperone function